MYLLPQARLFLEYLQTATPNAIVMHASISGPLAELIRYSEEDERERGFVGYYDQLTDEEHDWPNRETGSIVDQDYAKVWIENALLRYADYQAGAGHEILKVDGYSNRVRAENLIFATTEANDTTYSRSASLKERDVKVGDIARVRYAPPSGDPVLLWTSVKSLVGDEVAGEVDAAEADAANASTASVAAVVTKTGGVENCVDATASAASYDGRASGKVTETYIVRVIEGSVNGDHTTASLRVFSSDGSDDQAAVTPSAAGDTTEIGTRGLVVTFDTETGTCSASAELEDVPADDLIAGQEWTVAVTQGITATTATAAGTYTGEATTEIIVEVFKGGVWADGPQIRCRTTDGGDVSGPTTVTGSATAVAAGAKGATVAFSGLGLVKGDKWSIPVTGVAEGARRTIVLRHSLSAEVPADSEVSVSLYIKQDLLQVPKNVVESPPDQNWDSTEDEITINAGLSATDSSWVEDGELLDLPVYSEPSKRYGRVYVEYRQWLQDFAGSNIQTISVETASEASSVLPGPLHPDNVGKYGAYMAALNSNGAMVRLTPVSDPDDIESWNKTLEHLTEREDVHGLVPLTLDTEVQTAYVAHCRALTEPAMSRPRRAWLGLRGYPSIPLVSAGSSVRGYASPTTSDGAIAKATISDDGDGAFTIVNVTTANADLLTLGVTAKDRLRIEFTTDGFGGVAYEDYEIADVNSEDEFVLSGVGAPAAIAVATKIEIWRNLSAEQEKDEIKQEAGAWGSALVSAIWPDEFENGEYVLPSYFMAAVYAGLASGVVPHQGLTNVEVLGVTAVPRTKRFSRAQLDEMAEAGVHIVTSDNQTGAIYCRHALTTAGYDAGVALREEMCQRNSHNIGMRILEVCKPYIGRTNVQRLGALKLETEIRSVLNLLRSERSTPELGGQITEVLNLRIEMPEAFPDRYIPYVRIRIPAPTNNVDLNIGVLVGAGAVAA